MLPRLPLAILAAVCAAHGSRLSRVSWSPATWQHLYALLARPGVADHGRAPVAAFDADGTLWSGDAFGALGAVLVRRGLVDREACERVEVEYGRSQGEERRKWLLESLALFRGLSAEELVDAGEEAWGRGDGATGLGATLRPEMSDLVNRLRSGGWRVLIVTASPAEAVLRGAQAGRHERALPCVTRAWEAVLVARA